MNKAYMSPEQFNRWMSKHKLTVSDAAALLGTSRDTVRRYTLGISKVPLYIGLACAAVRRGLNVEDAYR